MVNEMINKLKAIYKDKLIENVNMLDTSIISNKYYYFYNPVDLSCLAIEKSISEKEYLLLSSSLIERKIYDHNTINQLLYEYLFDNKSYPYKEKRKIIILEEESSEINQIFDSIFSNYQVIKISNHFVYFVDNRTSVSLEELSSIIVDDIGHKVMIHNGIYVNNELNGNDVLKYLSLTIKYLDNSSDQYSDMFSPFASLESFDKVSYMELINNLLIAPLFKSNDIKELVLAYFKCDLNVLKTSKYLYINRNTILNKFEYIYKEYGINLQRFTHCSIVYLLLSFK